MRYPPIKVCKARRPHNMGNIMVSGLVMEEGSMLVEMSCSIQNKVGRTFLLDGMYGCIYVSFKEKAHRLIILELLYHLEIHMEFINTYGDARLIPTVMKGYMHHSRCYQLSQMQSTNDIAQSCTINLFSKLSVSICHLK